MVSGQATAGTPVFGHAGAIVGDTIVYVDGAYEIASGNPHYVASDKCDRAKFKRAIQTKLNGRNCPRTLATRVTVLPREGQTEDQKIYFTGGTDNPYNINGIGYDGKPSEPSPITFAFNIKTSKWEVVNENTPEPTMDHRDLVATKEGLIVVGGMVKGQQVHPR